MPNWVYIDCEVTGPKSEIEKFLKECTVRPSLDDTMELSFNKIVPMPPFLEDTMSGSKAWDGYRALTGESSRNYKVISEKELTDEERIKEINRLILEDPQALIEGAKSIYAEKFTGHTDWYSWRLEHWGTKWEASDCQILILEDGSVEMKLETAWSFPEPIFRELAERYPALTFFVRVTEEANMFCAEGSFGGPDDFAYSEAV